MRDGGNSTDLPILPQSVVGDVDFMVGIKYLRYHPKPIFQLPSGLTIYESIFKNPDGSRGVIGGTHHVFATIEKQFNGIGKNSFLCNQLNIFKSGFQVFQMFHCCAPKAKLMMLPIILLQMHSSNVK